MTINELKELEKKSYKGKVFFIMENGKYYVVENIAILPFKDTTLGEYIQNLENGYNAKIEGLENIIDTQKQIIDNLTSAIKTLNGGV